MNTIPVLGMDPSMSNWGLAYGHFDLETHAVSIERVEVIKPEQINCKQVRKNSQDIYRARQLVEGVFSTCTEASAIFIEVPHGSQSARSMASYGICIGILGAIAAQGIPFYELTATNLKLGVTGSGTASKQEVIDTIVTQYPDTNWPYRTQNGQQKLVTGKAEHMADAVGAITTGVKLPEFQQLLQFIKAA